jgi:hypothetical protein
MKDSLYLFGLVIRVIMITMLQLSEQIAIVFSHIFTCVIPFFIILSFAVEARTFLSSLIFEEQR